MIEDGHLGGTAPEGDPDSHYPEMWDWLISEFKLKNVLDVGCGISDSMKYFAEQGLKVWGVEGSKKVMEHSRMPDKVSIHDLTTGPFLYMNGDWGKVDPTDRYDADWHIYGEISNNVFWPRDLVWSCEVGEHIEEKFVDNFVQTLTINCRQVLAMCAAPKNCGGYHHVNCQEPQYWIEKIENQGLIYQKDLTIEWRERCVGAYFKRSGLIFFSPLQQALSKMREEAKQEVE